MAVKVNTPTAPAPAKPKRAYVKQPKRTIPGIEQVAFSMPEVQVMLGLGSHALLRALRKHGIAPIKILSRPKLTRQQIDDLLAKLTAEASKTGA